MGIIVSRSMRTIIGLWVHLLKWLIISRRWCTLPDFGGGGGLNDSPTVGEASERFNNPPLLYWGTELKFEAPTWFHRDGFSLEWFRMGWGGHSSKDAMVICHNLSRIQSIQSQLSINSGNCSADLTRKRNWFSGSGALPLSKWAPTISWLSSFVSVLQFTGKCPIWGVTTSPKSPTQQKGPKGQRLSFIDWSLCNGYNIRHFIWTLQTSSLLG